MGFRKDFVWGAATASYQVEGAAFEDGKGRNIWDVFSHTNGKVYENHNGDIACDEYHRYKEDVQLLKAMDIKAYRFSVSWARILPEGTGRVNPRGIDYYNRLIDELIANGIEPYMTLYHWDLPYALHLQGGWQNPASPEWFYEYAKVLAVHFSDRVKYFFTLNEPQCIVGLGYERGEHAPGLRVGTEDYFRIWHNVLKAHGRSVQALREYARGPIQIGAASCGAMYGPNTSTDDDIEAARRATFSMMGEELDACSWDVALFTDPVYLGQYPEDILRRYGQYFPRGFEQDLDLIRQKTDFHGHNIYNCVPVRADENGNPVRVRRPEGFPKTAIQWPVTPESLYWGPKFLYERYRLPVYITENGMSAHDWVSLDGRVHDPNRIDFMHRYLSCLKRACEEGVDIPGYFAWSLMDNFEWANGYNDRFGLVYVDYASQKRIVKDSGYYYREIIQSNGENL